MNQRVLVRTALFACLALVCAVWLPASAQRTVRSPNQDESDGVRVGGKWVEFHSEDKMTAARKVRFELMSDNYLSEDPDYKPRIELVCTNGKYSYADFNPGIRLGPPNRPVFGDSPRWRSWSASTTRTVIMAGTGFETVSSQWTKARRAL